MIFVTYRPLEVKGHPDGRALGDGVGVGAEDLCERGPVRARRLRVDDLLRVFETHTEKDLAFPGLVATHSAGAGEGLDLQLEEAGGEGLRVEEEVEERGGGGGGGGDREGQHTPAESETAACVCMCV